MKVGKKLFPYPTLNNAEIINSYEESHYSLKFDLEINSELLNINNIHIDIENISIEKLLNDGKAQAVLVIECSQTIYRKIYDISTSSIDINIQLADLNGTVEISSYIYAKEDISQYSSEYFIDDYKDYKFDLDKYNILAIDDGYRIKINHDDKEDKKISSIFSVVPNSDASVEEGINVYPDKDSIVIVVPHQYFGLYDNMRFNDNFNNIFFGLLGIPALSNCLQIIRDNFENYNEDLDEVLFEYNWFSSVLNRYENIHNKKMTSEDFKEQDIVWFSQELLNYGSSKAIGDLNKLLWEEKTDDLY